MAMFTRGTIGDIFMVRLEPNEDILKALQRVAKEADIETGLIVSITGGLTKARVQRMDKVGRPEDVKVNVIDVEGPMGITGSGIIGQVKETSQRLKGRGYNAGDPYIHAHITLTNAETTICGHLMEGCLVRSLHPISHFIVVIAKLDKMQLNLKVQSLGTSHETVYHELLQF